MIFKYLKKLQLRDLKICADYCFLRIRLMWMLESHAHLDIDAFVCLTDAGDGRRRGLTSIGGGAGVMGRIQKALL